MIKGVIFDLGGTLIRFQGNWADVVQQGAEDTAEWYLKKRHVKVDRDNLIEAIIAERERALRHTAKTGQQALMTDILQRALQQTGASERAQAMIEEALRAFFAPEEAAYTPFADATQTVKILRNRGLKVGILSNAPSDPLIQRLVNANSLRPWVSPVFSSAGLGWCKPMPQPFQVIAERWKLLPHEIVVVGDTLSADILGAKNAGMLSILARMTENETNHKFRYIQPNGFVDCLAQIPLLLETWPKELA